MRILTLVLGAVLAAYGSAGLLSQTVWQHNLEANHDLCRVLLCVNEPLEDQARQRLAAVGEEDSQKAIALFKDLLQRDSQDAYRWADLGEAYADAGQKEIARYCYDQVQALAPYYANLLLRAANFHFQVGENKEALAVTARILRLTPDYDSVIFSEYTRLVAQIEDVLRYGLPEDSRAAQSWLRFLIEAVRIDDAQRTWDWVAERGYSDDTLAGEYVEFLIRRARPDLAASVWSRHLAKRAGDYRKANYLFNGSLESEPSRSPFDWMLAHVQGAEVTRDCTITRPGSCSLRIEFASTQNLDFAAASQMTFVTPSHYRFHAFIRTEGLTTDQGIRFRISDAEAPAHLDMIFGQFTGTKPWTDVEQDVVVPSGTRLLQVQMIRQRSLRFDNKIAGAAWIEDLSLEPIGIRSPR